MTIASIHQDVESALRKAPQKVEQRRRAIAILGKGLQEISASEWPILRRRNVWFSTTQTDTVKAKGDIRVQILGIEVGVLELDQAAKAYRFFPKGKRGADGAEHGWMWSKNSPDAKRIREFLSEERRNPKANLQNEREIQWQLAEALRARPKALELQNMRPVTWNDCFAEIGVSVKASGDPKTGNVDLLVRRGKINDRGFLVFELKKPGNTGVEKALVQAIRYATALAIEANEDGSKNLENYHRAFGSSGKGALKIGAVAVLEDSDVVRKSAPAILQRYWADRGKSEIDRLGVLLYRTEEDGLKWSWLKDWDARAKQ